MKCTFYLARFTVVAMLLCVCGSAFSQVKPHTLSQIEKLIAEKQSRTSTERKISSQLLQATREAAGKQMVDGVNLRPARVNADASGDLLVDINAQVTGALLAKITALGGKIVFSSGQFHSIRAKINLSKVGTIAGYPEVLHIKPAVGSKTVGSGITGPAAQKPGGLYPTVLNRVPFKDRAARVQQQLKQYLMMLGTGAAESQGDHAMGADSARAKYGYMGEGVRVAVLSDSYNSQGTAAADVASGDLPGPGNPLGDTTPVTVLQDFSNSTDEGRAMLQIVHDLAPKAQLFFATADVSEAGFASNIMALRAAPYNCDIIIDDVEYFDESPFQDGIIAQAVNSVTASGALYFSSAGNSGSVLMSSAGVYEGDFNDTGSPAFTGSSKAGTVHNFGTVALPSIGDQVLVSPYFSPQFYSLCWADPLGGSSNDYDLFLIDSSGNVKGSSTDVQDGTGDPFEGISPPTVVAGDRLVVFKTTSAAPRAFNLNTLGGVLGNATTGQTHGHSSAASAFSVAATDAQAAYPGVFTSSSQVEYFSSDGPRHMFYNADSTPVTPGNFLFKTNGGVVRNKPDLTAADGVSTTFPSSSGLNLFYGTSAAAPHAAAVAALLKSAKPSLTPAQIRTILTTTALDIEAAGYDINSGYGIVQALPAMQQLAPAGLPSLTQGTITTTEGSFSNHNGIIDPGEVANLTVQLLNLSKVNAPGVNVTITTNTPGITITTGTAAYGAITAGGGAVNTNTPFVFAVGPNVACGTVVTFYVQATLGGGAVSPQSFICTVTIGAHVTNISGVLGQNAPTGSTFTSVSGQQTGRLSRGTVASTCAAPIPPDTLLYSTGSRQYDAYTFTNTSSNSVCVSVTLVSTNGLNIYTASYDSAGFVPSNPATNFVADPGQSAAVMQYSFTAPAGKKYTIVVHDVNVVPASGSAYSLSVSYVQCAAAPPCSPVKITTPTLVKGSTGVAYRQLIHATGGSGDYIYTYSGVLPAGINASGDSLYGTPTQAGQFPIKIVVSDAATCPADSATDTLTIAGDLPASVTAFAGTPQSTGKGTTFADTLKAKVLDASSKVVAGVKVLFTAPATAPSGTFANGTDTATAVTGSDGIAWAPVFTAGGTNGTYQVLATVTGVATAATFTLTNTCGATVVTNNADSGPGSLRYIITNACAGASITFAPGISNISLTSGELIVLQGVTINGPGAQNLLISGSNSFRVFKVLAPDTATVNIAGLAMENGVPQDTSTNGGGGILIYSGNVNISNCYIANNDASLTTYGEGGGVDNEGGTVTIDHTSVVLNYALYDGGGIAAEYGTMAITNSTIAENQIGNTGGTIGGGIFNYNALTLTNSTVYGNVAQGGGNIYNYQDNGGTGTLAFKNSIIAGGQLNTTGGVGADIGGRHFNSAGFNLIQNTIGGTISGTTNSNITGVDPGLLPLANYGGGMPTLLPLPTSAVINQGDTSLTAAQTDQRGYTRVAAGRADIGAVEANYLASTAGGTPQSAVVKTEFGTTLLGQVTENNNAIKGITVYFKAPVSGASGTFAGDTANASAQTNAAGIATAPAFTANDSTGTYNVADSIGAAFANAWFTLTNKSVLAVTFGKFTATVNNCAVQLSWQTLTGEAGETFTVEHSTDGINFTPIYSTPAQGNSVALQTYTYTHQTPSVGANYYRIKQTDVNGAVNYTSVITVINTCSNAPVVAYPNPAHTTLTLVMQGQDLQTINVYDAAGHLVTRFASVTGMLNTDVSHWASGVYTITAIKGDKTTYSLSVIKN